MIPYGRQDIDEEDIEAVVKVLRSDYLTTGPVVEQFEAKLSEFVESPTFVVNSGTAALHCAYASIGLTSGDEVITPPNTFVATQATASIFGAKVVFADIDSETGLISIESVAEKITPRTKVIVLVDYAGQPCDVDAFRTLIQDSGIYLFQDAAHSLGTTYKGRNVGSIADITTFSFYPTKNITTGEGGAVSSANQTVFLRAKRFARQGLVRESTEFKLPADGPWHQEVHQPGLNYRLTDFQCALGISQLRRIDYFKKKRLWIREFYKKELGDIGEIEFIREVPFSDPMWHLFPILVSKESRRDLYSFLRENGVGTQVNYFPANRHPYFSDALEKKMQTPNSDLFYERELSLPNYVSLEESNLEYICGLIRSFYGKKN